MKRFDWLKNTLSNLSLLTVTKRLANQIEETKHLYTNLNKNTAKIRFIIVISTEKIASKHQEKGPI